MEKEAEAVENHHGREIKEKALPHIYHTVNFLANYFVRFLPKAKCHLCHEPLLGKIKDGKQDKKFPDRTFCGHWFHCGCIEKFVDNPPFVGPCPMPGCD
jgi:hypothetical protein